jgi:aspartate/glutamate racemase
MKDNLVFGIIGGNGPLASATLHLNIMKSAARQGAHQDTDFPNVIMTSIGIPEFSAAGYSAWEDIEKPFEKSLRAFALLEVNFIVISCNTWHMYFDQMKVLANEILPKAKLLNLVELVSQKVPLSANRVAVFASEASNEHKLYEQYIQAKVIYPCQEKVTQLIDSSMQGNITSNRESLAELMQWVGQQKVDSIIFGCTELHDYILCHEVDHYRDTIIDSLNILTHHIVGKD